MRGIFGKHGGTGGAPEVIDPAVARLLTADAQGPAVEWPAGFARVVTFDWDDEGHVTTAAPLEGLAPLDGAELPVGATLEGLARLCEALAPLHALGIAHGDLAPETVRVAGDGSIAVLRPARQMRPGTLLAARVRSGEPASVVAMAAPEVVTGFEATPAADVYAVAALTHRIVSGQAPLGQLDLRDARDGTLSPFAALVLRALAASPSARPSIAQLGAELRRACDAARAFDETAAARQPYRDANPSPTAAAPPPRSPAEAAVRRADASNVSAILSLLLVVGGMFVFSGAVWLVAVNWTAMGAAGHFVLLAMVTAGVLGASHRVKRRGYARSAAALLVLGMELLWADAAYVLDVTHHLDDMGAWAGLACAMTLIAFALGALRRSTLFGALAAVHLALFAGFFGDAIHTGNKAGPPAYWLAIAALYAGGALLGHTLRGRCLGVPFASGAALMAWVSVVAALTLLGNDAFTWMAVGWPYLVALFAAGIGLAGRQIYAQAGWVTACGILGTAPTVTALALHDRSAYLLLAVAVGFALVATAFRVPRVAGALERQTTAVLLGLVNATAATTSSFSPAAWTPMDCRRWPVRTGGTRSC